MSDFLKPYEQQPTRFLCPWDSPGKYTGVGCHFLLQGIFLTQGSNLQLLCLLNQQAGSTTGTTWEALYACVPGCYSKYYKYISWLNHSSLYETVVLLSYSVQLLSHVQLFVTPWTQHIRLSCPSPTGNIFRIANCCLIAFRQMRKMETQRI